MSKPAYNWGNIWFAPHIFFDYILALTIRPTQFNMVSEPIVSDKLDKNVGLP